MVLFCILLIYYTNICQKRRIFNLEKLFLPCCSAETGGVTSFQLSLYPFHSHTKRRRRRKTTTLLYVRYILFSFIDGKREKGKKSHYICEKKWRRAHPSRLLAVTEERDIIQTKCQRSGKLWLPPFSLEMHFLCLVPLWEEGGEFRFPQVVGERTTCPFAALS